MAPPWSWTPNICPHSTSSRDDLSRHAGDGQMVDVMSDVTDFHDTAERLGKLDALVSVDTAVAHLAGAMGLPTFVPLPHTPGWRWMLSRSDTPWYQSVGLFQKTTPGNWRGPIRALRGVLSAHSEP